MDTDITKPHQSDEPSEPMPESPPRKKIKTGPIDPIKELLGKSQTFLNSDFTYYYQNVGLFENEAEWEEFSQILYKELPTTFRITNNTSFTEIVLEYVKDLFVNPIGANDEPSSSKTFTLGTDVVVQAPSPLPWYPHQLAWHFAASRKALRTSSLTKHLKHFLTHETEIGNVSRQEAVSMIPPLVLDVQPHHKVLDMCAAPGSKTCQIIEMLHAGTQGTPTGFVMANDANIGRCYLLTHQVHRLASPAVVTSNYDATQFPQLKLDADPSQGLPEELLEFDRILCDVPCSGDGTIRKNPSASSGWDSSKPFKLFKLQLAIAERAAQLLKVGGRMVYSTCAFNPVEDEAVVAQLLRSSQGALKLIDISSELPALSRKPGISTWKVIDQKKKIYATPEDIPEASRQRIPAAVFPPSAEEAASFKLERCARFYPHLQDTGGFFVAVIEKTGTTSYHLHNDLTLENLGLEPDGKVPKGERTFSEDPFYRVPKKIQDDITAALESYYGIADARSPEFTQLLLRCPEPPSDDLDLADVNMVYKVSKPVYDLFNRTRGQRPRFIAAGIRFLENFGKRNKHLQLQCEWRITAEALAGLANHLTKRVIKVGYSDFQVLLRENQPQFASFSAPLCETLTAIAKDGVGVVAIKFDPEPLPENHSFSKREALLRSTPQWIMGWLGFTSLTTAIKKLELMSWKNLYLTPDYSFEFDPVVNTMADDVKSALIEENKRKKRERDQERKENLRAAKLQRRKERREAAKNSNEENQ